MNIQTNFIKFSCCLFLFFAHEIKALASNSDYQISNTTELYKNVAPEDGGGVDLSGSIDLNDPSIDHSQLYESHTIKISLNQDQFNSLFFSEQSLPPASISIDYIGNIPNLLDLSLTTQYFPGNEQTLSFVYEGVISSSLDPSLETEKDFFTPAQLHYTPKNALLLPNHDSTTTLRYHLYLNKPYIDYSQGYQEKKSKLVRIIIDVKVISIQQAENLSSNSLRPVKNKESRAHSGLSGIVTYSQIT
ncbi:MAG: hypothetical protein K2W97_02050 [Chthoniobacterales bacterium]|nr:hypothetical protein [Chthoniobacterales bacterium]